MEKAKLLPELAELARIGPHTVSHAPCQEVVITDNRRASPTCRFCSAGRQDGGRYLTLTMCHSKDPQTGKRNIGMYRVQVYDDQTVGMHWQIHKGGAAHFRDAQRAGRREEAHGGGCGYRRGPRQHLCGQRAAAAGRGRTALFRLSAPQERRGRAVQDGGCEGTRPRRDRAWRATSIPTSCARRGRSATTPATTRPSSRIQ